MSRGPFQRVYPPKGSILFDGGLNNKFERSLIEDNESPDCLNVVFSNGAAETRQGVSKVNTAAVGAYVGDGLYTRKARDTSETMVAFWGGHMYTLVGTSFITTPSAQSVFTAGVRVGAAQDENYIFVGNGGVIPYKYNGTDFTRHGVYPPTTTATVANTNLVGVLSASAQYQYKVTYRNSGLVESDVGPVCSTFSVSATSGQQLVVAAIPVAPTSYGVNARRLYRTANGGTTFKLIATIADNSTTTYTDNIADSALGATAPTDNGVPPKYSVIIYHPGQNRLFMNDSANPNYIWWTEVGSPYTVGSTNFKIAGDNTSDLVKSFAIFETALVVFCDNSITIGFMPSTTTSEWRWVVLKAAYGCKSPYAPIRYKDLILFPAVQNGLLIGFAALSGAGTLQPSVTLLTASAPGSEMKSDRIEPDIFNFQSGYIGNISGIVFKNKAYISCTYGSGQATNNRYYTFDFSLSNLNKKQPESWVPNSGTPIVPSQFTIYNGSLYFQSATTTGFVYRMENGTYSDDGSAINSYYWTKEFAGLSDEINNQKDFRYANLLIETSGAYFADISWRVDSDNTTGGTAQLIDLNPGGSLWGSMRWGIDAWGGGSAQKEVRQSLGGSRGKRIQFRFSNRNIAGQKFKVYRLHYNYNLKGFR